MKTEKINNIVAYRIHDDLFCPKCYAEAANALKDSEVTIPGKAFTEEDLIGPYICKQCKAIIRNIPLDVELLDVEDNLEEVFRKIRFINDSLFDRKVPLSEKGMEGLRFFLSETEDIITNSIGDLSSIRRDEKCKKDVTTKT